MGGQECQADVLVIGSGPIGATYARILVEAGRSVVMVDAGARQLGNAHQEPDNLVEPLQTSFLQVEKAK